MTRIVYLDNNATTQIAPEVLEVMISTSKECFGNPSAIHYLGKCAAYYVDQARKDVAQLLGADAAEIIFTSCGTESNNIALQGIARNLPQNKRHLITTPVEHPAVLKCMKHLETEGFKLTILSVDEHGQLDMEEVRQSITPETGIISIMLANNETGVIFPVREISKIAKEVGALLHVDAVQAVGKIPISVKDLGIDLLSLSGHKFYAPKGIGALYIRSGIEMPCLMFGGKQECGIRPGTHAVHNIIGLGEASKLAQDNLTRLDQLTRMRDHLEDTIVKNIPEVQVNGKSTERLPNTSSISFRKIVADELLSELSDLGVCVSSGAACGSGTVKFSHVLSAMKLPESYLRGTLRFSLSHYTTQSELNYAIEQLKEAVTKLRKKHDDANLCTVES